MAILTGHGTLVTAYSPALALLRAQCFEHRSRKAWEVKALGLPGVVLLDDVAEKVSQGADVYADLLFENYAQQLFATDPDALDRRHHPLTIRCRFSRPSSRLRRG